MNRRQARPKFNVCTYLLAQARVARSRSRKSTPVIATSRFSGRKVNPMNISQASQIRCWRLAWYSFRLSEAMKNSGYNRPVKQVLTTDLPQAFLPVLRRCVSGRSTIWCKEFPRQRCRRGLHIGGQFGGTVTAPRSLILAHPFANLSQSL